MNIGRYKKSDKAYKKACQWMPGGVNSPVRAFGGVECNPVFIDHASGSRIWDVDGNCYLDYVGSWGPMVLGHGRAEVIEAVKNAAEKGLSFGAPTEAETELCKRIAAAFEGVDKVRLVNSGTEAVMTAIRLARGFTGREMIVKMQGCYHGHSDSLLVAAGSGAAENAQASSAGVCGDTAAATAVVPYNDLEVLKKLFAARPGQIAAVVVEPIAANMGVVLPSKGYLAGIRELCDEFGALLIIDEVITGFRLCFGGVCEMFGVKADIVCLGKIAGGGMPLAAFAARTEIMDRLAPLGDVYQAGTLSGNPVAVAAAITTLDILSEENIYPKLDALGAKLQEGLKNAADKSNIDLQINRAGSLLGVFFTNKPVNNFNDVKAADIGRFKRYFAAMLDRGIYLAPSAYESMFISAAHSEADIDRTIEAAGEVFSELSLA